MDQPLHIPGLSSQTRQAIARSLSQRATLSASLPEPRGRRLNLSSPFHFLSLIEIRPGDCRRYERYRNAKRKSDNCLPPYRGRHCRSACEHEAEAQNLVSVSSVRFHESPPDRSRCKNTRSLHSSFRSARLNVRG
jgi:hypothetical protein